MYKQVPVYLFFVAVKVVRGTNIRGQAPGRLPHRIGTAGPCPAYMISTKQLFCRFINLYASATDTNIVPKFAWGAGVIV